jgi:hypothetical protein
VKMEGMSKEGQRHTCPNLSVDTVSSKCTGAAVIVNKIAVLEFPPSDCFRIRVSLESRYGMKSGFPA